MDDGWDPATSFRHAMEAYSRLDYDAAVVDFDPALEWIVDATVAPDATTLLDAGAGERCAGREGDGCSVRGMARAPHIEAAGRPTVASG